MFIKRKARLVCLLLVGLSLVSLGFAEIFGVNKKIGKPEDFDNVIMNNYAEGEGVAPVVFNHWEYRTEFICRLCHDDLGFAMTHGTTRVREEDIRLGFYCGVNHTKEGH